MLYLLFEIQFQRAQKVWINIAAVIIMAFVIDKFLDTY